MGDFLAYVIADAAGGQASSDLIWSVTFTDGQTRVGKVEHLGDTAYVMSGNEKFYFASDKVVHAQLHRANGSEMVSPPGPF